MYEKEHEIRCNLSRFLPFQFQVSCLFQFSKRKKETRALLMRVNVTSFYSPDRHFRAPETWHAPDRHPGSYLGAELVLFCNKPFESRWKSHQRGLQGDHIKQYQQRTETIGGGPNHRRNHSHLFWLNNNSSSKGTGQRKWSISNNNNKSHIPSAISLWNSFLYFAITPSDVHSLVSSSHTFLCQ